MRGRVFFLATLVAISAAGLLFPFYEDAVFYGVAACLLILVGKRRAWDFFARRLGRVMPRGLLVAVLSVVIFFGNIEWATRLATAAGLVGIHTPTQTKFLKRRTEDWRMVHIVMDDATRVADPVLLWRPVRRHPYNAQGFKGPVADVPKPAGVYRVICYGDSNTDGPERGSWPGALGRLLDEKRDSGGRRYEVLNAGVVGYSSYQGLRRFRQEVDRYAPDLVFVSFGWNDLPGAMGKPDREFRVPRFVGLIRFLIHYEFYRSLMHYIGEAARAKEGPPPDAAREPRVSLEDYLKNMREFRETARAHGTEVIFLTRPHQTKAQEMERLPGWRSRVPLYNRELVAWAGREAARVIDVQHIFETRYPDDFGDEAHFHLEGHRRMAQVLHRTLTERGWL